MTGRIDQTGRRERLAGLAAGLAMAGCMLFAAAPAGAEDGVTADTITIGGIGPLTGPLTAYGQAAFNGVQLVYDEVNAAGGINGRKLVYVREDDRCQPSDAVAAVKKLIYDTKVFMIHGGYCSNASVAAKPEIAEADIPWVIVASTLDGLTNPVDPFIFTTQGASWMDTTAQLDYAIAQGAKKIAIVSQRDAWGQDRYKLMLDLLAKKGITPVADVELAADATDASVVVLQLQQAQPDAVVALLFTKAAGVYLRDAAKFGFQPLTVGPPPVGDLDIMAQLAGGKDAIKNVVATYATYLNDDPRLQKWRDLLEKTYPGEKMTLNHALGIASGQFVVEALKRAGPDLTRARLAEVLSTLELQTDTVPTPLKCTPEDHQCYKAVPFIYLKDGQPALTEPVQVSR